MKKNFIHKILAFLVISVMFLGTFTSFANAVGLEEQVGPVNRDLTVEERYVVDTATSLINTAGLLEGFELYSEEDYVDVMIWLQQMPQAMSDVYNAGGLYIEGYAQADAISNIARNTINSLSLNNLVEFQGIFAGFGATVTKAQAAELAQIPGVHAVTVQGRFYVEAAHNYKLDPTYVVQGNKGGRQLGKVGEIHSAGYTGEGVIVGVIDAGIYPNHTDLNNVAAGYNFANATTNLATGANYHGTHVAGTIASTYNTNNTNSSRSLGLAPGATLLNGMVFGMGAQGDGASQVDIAAALEVFSGYGMPAGNYPGLAELIASGKMGKVDVINMSLGNNSETEYGNGSFERNNAVLAGVVLVNSAGNEAYPSSGGSGQRNTHTVGSGAAMLSISVAATTYGSSNSSGTVTSTTTPADFSSIGPTHNSAFIKPDITAPGNSIYSTYNSASAASYSAIGGTSMSSPFVAGSAALLIDYLRQNNIEYTPADIRARLMATANSTLIKTSSRSTNKNGFIKAGTQASVWEQGAGYVDIHRATVGGDTGYFLIEHDYITGHINKSMAKGDFSSFNFGVLSAKQGKTLTARVFGIENYSLEVVYAEQTRYSNANTNRDVVVTVVDNGNKTFNATMYVGPNATRDDRFAGNLYEGYVKVTDLDTNRVYNIPWGTRIEGFLVDSLDAITVPDAKALLRPALEFKGDGFNATIAWEGNPSVFSWETNYKGTVTVTLIDSNVTTISQGIVITAPGAVAVENIVNDGVTLVFDVRYEFPSYPGDVKLSVKDTRTTSTTKNVLMLDATQQAVDIWNGGGSIEWSDDPAVSTFTHYIPEIKNWNDFWGNGFTNTTVSAMLPAGGIDYFWITRTGTSTLTVNTWGNLYLEYGYDYLMQLTNAGTAGSHGSGAVTITRTPVNFNVNVTVDGEGTVTGAGAKGYNTVAALEAIPAAGHHFVGWFAADVLVSEANPYSFTVVKDVNLVAKFAPNPVVNVEVKVNVIGNGEVTGAGIYAEGAEVTLAAAAAEGWAFAGFFNGEELITAEATYVFAAKDVEITAVFEVIPPTEYVIAVAVVGEGEVTGAGTFVEGTEVTLVATAAEGWAFVGFFNGEELITEEATLVFAAAADVTITAVFAEIPADTVVVNFAGLAVELQVKVDGVWTPVGNFTDYAELEMADGTYTFRAEMAAPANNAIRSREFNLTFGEGSVVFDIPVKEIVITGIAIDGLDIIFREGNQFAGGLLLASFEQYEGNTLVVKTFDNGKAVSMQIGERLGFYRTRIDAIDNNFDMSGYFYTINAPEGVVISSFTADIHNGMSFYRGVMDFPATSIAVLRSEQAVTMVYTVDGVNTTVNFLLDGSNPFAGIDFEAEFVPEIEIGTELEIIVEDIPVEVIIIEEDANN